MLFRFPGVVVGVVGLAVASVAPIDAAQFPFAQPPPAPRVQPPPRQLRPLPLLPPWQPRQPRPPLVVPPEGRPPLLNRVPIAPTPRVVCGMTLIPANPAVDPKIATKPDRAKQSDGTKFTIRPVQPPICW